MSTLTLSTVSGTAGNAQAEEQRRKSCLGPVPPTPAGRSCDYPACLPTLFSFHSSQSVKAVSLFYLLISHHRGHSEQLFHFASLRLGLHLSDVHAHGYCVMFQSRVSSTACIKPRRFSRSCDSVALSMDQNQVFVVSANASGLV